ncbi:MAG: hypothetical protein M4579_003650 [Chaenotheca gracillima]|nr:MAG: hypothetical protein M4579_003650 [Chaenotheca gracillima]
MKYSVPALALFAALVSSQSLPDVPTCSLACFTTALTSDGCSSLTDFKCHCSKPQLVSQIQPCVNKACSPADQQKVTDTVMSTCESVGEPIAIPSAGASSAAGASTGAATSAAETSAAETSAAATSAAETSAAATSAAETSAAATSAAATSAAATTAAATSAAATSGVASPSAAPPASTSVMAFTGAAAQPTGAFGVVAAIALAAAYAV